MQISETLCKNWKYWHSFSQNIHLQQNGFVVLIAYAMHWFAMFAGSLRRELEWVTTV